MGGGSAGGRGADDIDVTSCDLVERVRRRRVLGDNEDEELLDVPVERGSEVRAQVEADQRAVDAAVRPQRSEAVQLDELDDRHRLGADEGREPGHHRQHKQDG